MKRFRSSIFVGFTLTAWCVAGYSLPLTDAEVSGLSWTITNDTLADAAGGSPYEVFGIGHAFSGGDLYVVVRTNFDVRNGRVGPDSYGVNHGDPGDLYINLGGTYQDGTGTAYGIATTTHGNIATQVPMYSTWGIPVVAGGLYGDASGAGGEMFATGTWESYESHSLGHVGDPDDGDGNLGINSYPSFIRFGADIAGDNAAVYLAQNTTDLWDYDLYYRLDLDAIGYAGEAIQVSWTMECGNDAAQHMAEIPEPATVALLMTGAAAMMRKRKRA